jgi:hypothetical protein
MPVDEEKIRALREQAAVLTSLKKHAAWPLLNEIFEGKKKTHLAMVAAQLMGEDPINQRQLDWIRGYWQGCSWLLANPDMADPTLKRSLAGAKTLEDNG